MFSQSSGNWFINPINSTWNFESNNYSRKQTIFCNTEHTWTVWSYETELLQNSSKEQEKLILCQSLQKIEVFVLRILIFIKSQEYTTFSSPVQCSVFSQREMVCSARCAGSSCSRQGIALAWSSLGPSNRLGCASQPRHWHTQQSLWIGTHKKGWEWNTLSLRYKDQQL